MADFPLIGISGSLEKDESKQFLVRDYNTAILAAGGIPVLLSLDMNQAQLAACLAPLSGLLLAGGNDVAPSLFGETPVQALGEVNPLRDSFEMRLLNAAFPLRMPVLGICRGMQVMNVMMGGSLYQDIPSQHRTPDGHSPMAHSQTCPAQYDSHGVSIQAQTRLEAILGTRRLPVNSFHHQAVKAVAPPLRCCAVSDDGIIEAVESAEHPFFLGVQWHPERMARTDAHAAALFSALVEASRQFDAQRRVSP